MRVRNRMQLKARALREIRALRAAENAKQQQSPPPSAVRRGAKRQRPATPTDAEGGDAEEHKAVKRHADVAAPGVRCLSLLQAAVAPEDQISETNWLTGTLIDLVLWRLAQLYLDVHFLPTAFYHLHLECASRARRRVNARETTAMPASECYQVRDILGRQVDYTRDTPIVFIVNVGHIHWNLFRVTLAPTAKLQLFEPMGCVNPSPLTQDSVSCDNVSTDICTVACCSF